MHTAMLSPVIALFVVALPALAQDPTPGAQLPTDARGPVMTRVNDRIALIPAVIFTPVVGIGAGGVVALLGRRDPSDSTIPRPAAGIGALYASSASWLAALGGRTNFHHDDWRLGGGLGAYTIRYDFFGIGNAAGDAGESIRLAQNGGEGIVQLDRRLAKYTYGGIRARYLRMFTDPIHDDDDTTALGRLLAPDRSYTGSFLGVVADYDNRNNAWGPSHGALAHTDLMFSRDALGANRTFDSYRGAINGYWGLAREQVLAARIAGCGVAGDVPPWELCLFGANVDLRGYATGRYRDRAMWAAQAEWRAHVWRRFGAAAFAGAGGVASAFSKMSMPNVLASAGIGVRYLVVARTHTSIGADGAWGKRGGAFYLRMGQAF